MEAPSCSKDNTEQSKGNSNAAARGQKVQSFDSLSCLLLVEGQGAFSAGMSGKSRRAVAGDAGGRSEWHVLRKLVEMRAESEH